jgi:dTDP-glucose 4,6-dehydratase
MVTGGCGFIGSNFVRHILESRPDWEVVNLDKLTYAGRKENLSDVEGNRNYTFIHGDICSEADAAKAMEGCEAVINFAAESHVDRSISDASDFLKTNIGGVCCLLEEARKQDIRKFIQIGTDEVYGSVEKGASRESDMLRPRNPYSAAKAAADNLAFSYFFTYGLPVTVTRSSNNFGPYQYPEKLIPLFITNLLRGKKVPVYGDGMNVRDWLYVGDNCAAIASVLEKGKAGETYNIGGGNEKTNLEITELLLKELGAGREMVEKVSDRPGHDRRYCLDSSKAGEELGWRPEKEFGEAIKETVKWYRENKEWWEPLVH